MKLEEFMTDPAVLDALQALLDQLAEYQQRHAALAAAFVVLARRPHAGPDVLAQSLDTLAATAPEPGWQAELAELAGALRLPGDRA